MEITNIDMKKNVQRSTYSYLYSVMKLFMYG